MRKPASLATPLAALLTVLLFLAATAVRAEPGVLLGDPPLVRVSWSAVHAGDGVVHAPSTAVVLRSGGITLLETYDGSPFLLRQYAGRADTLRVMSEVFARSRIFALDGVVCSYPEAFGLLGSDRGATVAPGQPLQIHWYSFNGRRTADIEVRAEMNLARCSNDVQGVIGAIFSHLSVAASNPPTFATGFTAQASTLREVSGRVLCGNTSNAVLARVRLFQDIPYQCFPEACFPNDPPLLAETFTGPDGRFRLTIPPDIPGKFWLHAERYDNSCGFEFTQVPLPSPPINNFELRLRLLYDPEG
jgi:hypothetical protein